MKCIMHLNTLVSSLVLGHAALPKMLSLCVSNLFKFYFTKHFSYMYQSHFSEFLEE